MNKANYAPNYRETPGQEEDFVTCLNCSLEKAFDSVLREVMRWLSHEEVMEQWLVQTVMTPW